MKLFNLNQKAFILFVLAIMTQATISYSQCNDNLLLNGSFTGQIGNSEVATNWETESFPDVNDASGELNTSSTTYEWIGMVLPSPNEGTWQNVFGPETVFQFVELEIGKTYSLCIEYAAQGIQSLPDLIFDQPVGVNFIINDMLIYTSPLDETPYTWEMGCITFTATEAMNKIEFQASVNQYLGIDGACLTEDIMSSIQINEQKIDHYIYPNPVLENTPFRLYFPNHKKVDLAIYNSIGQMVFQESNVIAEDLVIPSNLFGAGTYFYTLKYDEVEGSSGSFIVNK